MTESVNEALKLIAKSIECLKDAAEDKDCDIHEVITWLQESVDKLST